MSKKNALSRKKYLEQYKAMMKGVPKRQRPPFSKVYRQIKQNEMLAEKTTRLPTGETVATVIEDVDMSELDDIFVDVEEGTDEVEDSQ